MITQLREAALLAIKKEATDLATSLETLLSSSKEDTITKSTDLADLNVCAQKFQRAVIGATPQDTMAKRNQWYEVKKALVRPY